MELKLWRRKCGTATAPYISGQPESGKMWSSCLLQGTTFHENDVDFPVIATSIGTMFARESGEYAVVCRFGAKPVGCANNAAQVIRPNGTFPKLTLLLRSDLAKPTTLCRAGRHLRRNSKLLVAVGAVISVSAGFACSRRAGAAMRIQDWQILLCMSHGLLGCLGDICFANAWIARLEV